MPSFPNINVTQAAAGSSQKETLINEAITALDLYEGVTAVAIVAGANTLTEPQARAGLVNLTGALASAATVTIPSTLTKLLMVTNSTTGGQTVQVRYGSGGTLYTVAAGDFLLIWPTGSRTFTQGFDSTTGTRAARPAAGTAGKLYLPTDDLAGIQRDSGTAWDEWGPLWKFTPPDDATFAWINQGGASVDTTQGGVFLNAPAGAGSSLRIRKKAAPATPYTVEAAFIPSMVPDPAIFPGMGLLFRESGTSKLVTFSYTLATTPFQRPQNWTNETTFSAGLTPTWDQIWNFQTGPLIWQRIADNGTNLLFSVSNDGRKWYQTHSVGRTAFMAGAPNEIGFWVNANSASYDAALWLRHWRVF